MWTPTIVSVVARRSGAAHAVLGSAIAVAITISSLVAIVDGAVAVATEGRSLLRWANALMKTTRSLGLPSRIDPHP